MAEQTVEEIAAEILKDMPEWQRKYAEEIIKSALDEESKLPRLLE